MHEIHPHLRFISPQNFPDPKFDLISDSPHPDIAPIQNLDFKIYPHLRFISPQNSPINHAFLSIENHDQWAKERRRILSSIQIPTNIDDLALVKNRFDGLERDVQKRKPQLELLEQKEHFNKFQICISHPSHFRTQKLL